MQGLIMNEGLKHLAEDIFGHLDASSLANCRLACHSWRCIIDENRHWWNLHVKKIRITRMFFVDRFLLKNGRKQERNSYDFFLDKFPTWNSILTHFENKAPLQIFQEFVLLLYNTYFDFSILPGYYTVHTMYGNCPIFESIAKKSEKHLKFFEFMLKHSNFDFNSTGYNELDKYTPLTWASFDNGKDFVQALIENAKQCGIGNVQLLSFLEKPRFSQQDQLRIEVTFSNKSLLLYANEKTSE